MLFSPSGSTARHARAFAARALLPRKIQEIPGIMQGGVGWQGIIPARAAKMGIIAVDKAISKLGTPGEFYQELEPDRIAEHIVELFTPQVPQMIDEVMREEQPALWRDVPPAGRRRSSRGCGSSSPASSTHHRRDRGAHRPAAGPQDHGDRAVPRRTRRWWCGSSATSASASST